MKVRRMGSAATILGLAGMLASSAGPAAGGQIRTDTSLGGFTVVTESAPLRILFDDPSIPIPRDPGAAIVEGDVSYTKATLDTGPTSRGVASSAWPGNLLGDGWSQIVGAVPIPGLPATYPIKADARYPDNPHTANGGDNGTFMNASALGLDVTATAQAVPTVPGGALAIGGATSTSTATIKDGVAIGTSISKVTDFDFMGLIHAGSVATTLTTKSDGKKPTSSGSTVVNGLNIAGYGYSVDDTGAHLVGVPVPGSPPLPSGALDPAKMLGITVEALSQTPSHDATSATRVASGLRIVIDTSKLRSMLSPATGTLQGPVGSIISQLPKKDPTGQIPFSPQTMAWMAWQTTPQITLIVGAGQGTTDAALPITFTWPTTSFGNGPPAPLGGPVVAGTNPVTAPITSGTVVPDLGPPPAPTTTTPSTQVAAASRPKDPFHGVPPGVLLLTGALVGTAAAGLLRLRNAAMAADSGSTLPDLRGDAT